MLHPNVRSCQSPRLRCASRHQLVVPRYRRSKFGCRAFSVAGPMVWNSLPDHLRDPTLGRPCRCHYVESWKATMVHETAEKSRRCQNDLLYYYQSVVRPVLEYASPCWHSSLTKEQNKQLEDVQRRALHIICGNISYDEARLLCNIPPLHERRHELGRLLVKHFSKESSESSRTFFGIYCQPSVMLNYQLDCARLC